MSAVKKETRGKSTSASFFLNWQKETGESTKIMGVNLVKATKYGFCSQKKDICEKDLNLAIVKEIKFYQKERKSA